MERITISEHGKKRLEQRVENYTIHTVNRAFRSKTESKTIKFLRLQGRHRIYRLYGEHVYIFEKRRFNVYELITVLYHMSVEKMKQEQVFQSWY